MTTRPARSASIPIPRNNASTSPTRNIESFISIPIGTSGGRSRPTSQGYSARTSVDDHRGLGVSHGVRGTSTSASALSTSPIRPAARSFTQPVGAMVRGPTRLTAYSYEPRIVRADSLRNIDPSCLPSSSASPTRTRRASATGVRAPSVARSSTGNLSQLMPSSSASFPRPAYLEHSALRHLLQTEAPPSLPPSRKPNVETQEPRTSSGVMSPANESDEESTFSTPPREMPPVRTVASPDQIMKLPTRWSDELRHNLLTLSENGRELTYQGTNCNGERDPAAARTIQSIPPACGIYYYEVEIRSKNQKANISIGFAGRDVRTSRLPGWEPNSWGYHGDDGCSFAAEKNGTAYGPTFGLGDIVGCGIDFSTNRAFFTKNGTFLGPVFENVGKGIELYPSVGLQHQGESIKVNFGHEPFKFDIEDHVQQQRNQTWLNILHKPLDAGLFRRQREDDVKPTQTVSEEQSKRTINELVLSYLAHHGYVKTARTFQKQFQGLTDERPASTSSSSTKDDHDVEMDDIPGPSTSRFSGRSLNFEADIELRTQIVNSVVSGNIDSALTETRKHHPTVLEAEEGLMLVKLRCRKFVELVLEAAELEKKMKATMAAGEEEEGTWEDVGVEEDGMGMDVDDEMFLLKGSATNGTNGTNGVETADTPISRTPSSKSRYAAALNEALTYGQTLDKEYRATDSPEIKSIFMQTFSILASPDPLNAGGTISEVAGQEARSQLANELNQAILKSQGRPVHPALETLYRHTAVCILQLGLAGVGAAAFADMQKEFLDS